jgi:hypothetical protein
VTQTVARALAKGRAIRAMDLAAGTGSNTRFLARSLPAPQEWLLVDHDGDLLQHARRLTGFELQTRVVDIARAGALAELIAGHDLVTASALLDLVSGDWLNVVCALCQKQQCVVLFTLSYDGRISCTPKEPDDELVRQLVNRHQRTDKGFGAALGPDAVTRAAEILHGLGYQVTRDRSDWALDRESKDLQVQLIEGWAGAATEVAPTDAAVIARWRQRRIDHALEQRSHIVVGHEDLGAFIA